MNADKMKIVKRKTKKRVKYMQTKRTMKFENERRIFQTEKKFFLHNSKIINEVVVCCMP